MSPGAPVLITLLVCLPTSLAAQGCSTVLFDHPPFGDWQTAEPETCMDSVALPLVDAFYTVLWGGAGLAILTQSSTSEGNDINAGGPVLIGFGSVFALSSAWGFFEAARCARYREHLGDRYPRP